MTLPPHIAKERRLAANRAWKKKNKQRVKEWQDKYNSDVRSDPARNAKKNRLNRESNKRNQAKRKAYDNARDKQKVFARNSVRWRINEGHIKRQPCEVCGEPKSHAHHKDYRKPLDVRWLCPKHHSDLHKSRLKKDLSE